MVSKRLISALTAMVAAVSSIPALPVVNAADAVKGDINGDMSVNSEDLKLLSDFLLGTGTLTEEQGNAADLCKDDVLDVYDLIVLRKQFKESAYTGLFINEVCSSAKDSVTDAAGESPDWLEIYNSSDKAMDISGVGVSDGKKNKFKFTFPQGTTIKPGEFILVYCDDAVNEAEGEYHAAFKLSATGETVYLTAPDGSEIDTVEVPELNSDITYGRYKDGSSDFKYLSYSPKASNNEATDMNVVEKPIFSEKGGFYDEEFQLTLADNNGNAIYYTTDGSDPRTSDTAKLYSDSIRIYNNTSEPNVHSAVKDITLITYNPPKDSVEKGIVIRACAKTADGRFSEVQHNSYFVGKTASYYKDMKVISMATDSDYLFDEDNGFYMVGKEYYEWANSPDYVKYDLADTRNPTNYNKDGEESEFPVSIQVIENGKAVYNADLGAKIAGNYTRVRQQRSFRLVTRSEYGDTSIKYPLFPELTDINGNLLERFDKVTLWNGGNDFQLLHFRDALVQELAADLNVETMASEPCILFLDGEFWGFYLIRERVDAEHLSNHYGLEEDDVVVVKNNVIDDGTAEDLNEFDKFTVWAKDADMTNSENYKKFCDTVDVDSFIDYMAVETYINNGDWAKTGMNNWQAWKSRTVHSDIPQANGKWQFVLYDTDVSMGIYNNYKQMASYDSLSQNSVASSHFNFPAILKQLIRNEDFCQKFYDRYSYIIENNFNKEKALGTLNAYVDAYRTATCDTYERFGMRDSVYAYDSELKLVSDFLSARPEHAKKYLDTYCGK